MLGDVNGMPTAKLLSAATSAWTGAGDNIAGFVYIGTPSEMPHAERDRPDPAQITIVLGPGEALNKGLTVGNGVPGAGIHPAKAFISLIKIALDTIKLPRYKNQALNEKGNNHGR